MGFKARRAYKVGDVVAVKVVSGYWTKDAEWVRTGHRILYQTIFKIAKRGDVPHTGNPNARFALDCSSCEEIQPRLSWRSQREFTLAIPI